MEFKIVKTGVIEKVYGPGSVFYDPAVNTYYEIIKLKSKKKLLMVFVFNI